MSNCCSTNGTSQTIPQTVMIGTCPRCGARGKKVDLETVKAMLRVSLRGLHPSTPYHAAQSVKWSISQAKSGLRLTRYEGSQFATAGSAKPTQTLSRGTRDHSLCYFSDSFTGIAAKPVQLKLEALAALAA